MIKNIVRFLYDGSFREKFFKTRDYYLKKQIQNIWFLTSVKPDHIGYGKGLLTWIRLQKHKRLRRKIHIVLLEYGPTDIRFGPLTAFWINEYSQVCSASLNSRLEEVDIVWIYSQDPINEQNREKMLGLIRRCKHDVSVINSPDFYNNYHADDVFKRLELAGVNVPRSTFKESDLGVTQVVYKKNGAQGANKSSEAYQGGRDGFTPYEFIDSRGDDGRYRRYRAFYLVGTVRPSKLMRCEHWNACIRNQPTFEYSFKPTVEEVTQINRIAETLQLEYFAVDYLRRSGDDKPFFTDVNVYPTIYALPRTASHLGYFDAWHTFDSRARLGMEEPGGKPFNEVFDDSILRFMDVSR